jgi:NDP-sugar pyrophosphorylase family protein
VDGPGLLGDVQVDPTAHIAPTVHLGAGSKIGPGVSLSGKTVIGPGCCIKANATLTDCVLQEGVIVGMGALLSDVILDDGCHVEAEVVVTVPSVLAAGTVLRKGTRIE